MLRKAAASAVAAAALAAGSAAAACDDVEKADAEVKKAAASKKPDPKSMAELQLGLATKQRRVFVTSGIDDESAKVVIQQPNPQPNLHSHPNSKHRPKHSPTPNKVVIQQLIHLEEAEPGAPISMHIMSGGGKVYAGLAILDVMRSLTSPVHTTCLGHCESMAAVLLTLNLTLTLRTLG